MLPGFKANLSSTYTNLKISSLADVSQDIFVVNSPHTETKGSGNSRRWENKVENQIPLLTGSSTQSDCDLMLWLSQHGLWPWDDVSCIDTSTCKRAQFDAATRMYFLLWNQPLGLRMSGSLHYPCMLSLLNTFLSLFAGHIVNMIFWVLSKILSQFYCLMGDSIWGVEDSDEGCVQSQLAFISFLSFSFWTARIH